jgi:hypothetical protein
MAATIKFKAQKGTFISLGYTLVEFNDGYYSTSDPRVVSDLRKNPAFGQIFQEVKETKETDKKE